MVSERATKIAKNTLMLYIQMFLGMLVGFYTSRVVLNELGVEDYGIYNVVGGIVAMFGLLNMSMASTTSRFVTIELGKNNEKDLKSTFGLALTIHLLLGVLVVVASEAIGLWFLNNKMNIPSARMYAAHWVFHLSIATAFISIINVPYNALIVAHERMGVYALYSLLDVCLKLVVVLILPFVEFDKLIFYACMLFSVQFLMQVLYFQFCFSSFKESRVGLKWNQNRFKNMSSFAGWSLFGDASALMFTQGLNLLLNVFFGPSLNAARGVAIQVQSVIIRFIGGFQTALNPQLFKSYAAKDYRFMHRLIFTSSKYSFYIFLLISIPVFFEADILLAWWLKIVPKYSVVFLRVIILISLIDCLANPLVISAKATGNIRKYQTVLGMFLLLIVPISFLFLRNGYPPQSVFIVHLFIAFLGHFLRVYLVKGLIDLSIKEYFTQVIVKIVVVFLLSSTIPFLVFNYFHAGFLRVLVISVSGFVSVFLSVWFLGSDKFERDIVLYQIKKRINLMF